MTSVRGLNRTASASFKIYLCAQTYIARHLLAGRISGLPRSRTFHLLILIWYFSGSPQEDGQGTPPSDEWVINGDELEKWFRRSCVATLKRGRDVVKWRIAPRRTGDEREKKKCWNFSCEGPEKYVIPHQNMQNLVGRFFTYERIFITFWVNNFFPRLPMKPPDRRTFTSAKGATRWCDIKITKVSSAMVQSQYYRKKTSSRRKHRR